MEIKIDRKLPKSYYLDDLRCHDGSSLLWRLEIKREFGEIARTLWCVTEVELLYMRMVEMLRIINSNKRLKRKFGITRLAVQSYTSGCLGLFDTVIMIRRENPEVPVLSLHFRALRTTGVYADEVKPNQG